MSTPGFIPTATAEKLLRLLRRRGGMVEEPEAWARVVAITRGADGSLTLEVSCSKELSQAQGLQLVVTGRQRAAAASSYPMALGTPVVGTLASRLTVSVPPPGESRDQVFAWSTTHLEDSEGLRTPLGVSGRVLARFTHLASGFVPSAGRGDYVPIRTPAGRLGLLPSRETDAYLSGSEWRGDRWYVEVTATAPDDSPWVLLPQRGTKKGPTIPLFPARKGSIDGRVCLQGEVSTSQLQALLARSSGIWEFSLFSPRNATILRVGPHPQSGTAPQAFSWERGSNDEIIVPCITGDGSLAVQFVRPSQRILGEQDRASVVSANWTQDGLSLHVRLESAAALWALDEVTEPISVELRGIRDFQEWTVTALANNVVGESLCGTEHPECKLMLGGEELSQKALLAGPEALVFLLVRANGCTWRLPLHFDSTTVSQCDLQSGGGASGGLVLESASDGRAVLRALDEAESAHLLRSIVAKTTSAQVSRGRLVIRGHVDDPFPHVGSFVQLVLSHSWGRDELTFDGLRVVEEGGATFGLTFDVTVDLEGALERRALWEGKWTARVRIASDDGQVWQAPLKFDETWRHVVLRASSRGFSIDSQSQLRAALRSIGGVLSVVVDTPGKRAPLGTQHGGPRVLDAHRLANGSLSLQIAIPQAAGMESWFLVLVHPAKGEVELGALRSLSSSHGSGGPRFHCEVTETLADILMTDREPEVLVVDAGRSIRLPLAISLLVLHRLAVRGQAVPSLGTPANDRVLVLPRRTSDGLFTLFFSTGEEPSLSAVEWREESLVLKLRYSRLSTAKFALELRSDDGKIISAVPAHQEPTQNPTEADLEAIIPLQRILEGKKRGECSWGLFLRVGSADRASPIRPNRSWGAVPQVVQTSPYGDGRSVVVNTNERGGISLQVITADAQFLREQDMALASELSWQEGELRIKAEIMALTGTFDPGATDLSFSLGFRGTRTPRLWEQSLTVASRVPDSDIPTEFPQYLFACDANELAGNCRLAGPITSISVIVRARLATRELPVIWALGLNGIEQERLSLSPLELGHHTFLLAESDAKNRLNFVTCAEADLATRGSPLQVKLTSGVLRRSRLCLRGDFSYASSDVASASASLVLRKLSTEECFTVPLSVHFHQRPKVDVTSATFSAQLNIHDLVSSGQLSHGKWEPRLRLQLPDGRIFERRLTGDLSGLNRRKAFQSQGRTFHAPSGLLVFPEWRVSGQFVLIVRPFSEGDSFSARCNQAIAFVLALVLPNIRDKKTWLVTEKKSETAQDNSFAFFAYCYEHHPERRVLYLMRASSPQRAKIKEFESRVVRFGSLRHYLLLLRSGVLVSSEASSHFVEFDSQPSLFKLAVRIKKYVFLQHGVTAMKNVANIFGRRGAWSADRFITTSYWEQEIARKYLGYSAEEAPVAGFARWDQLEDKSKGKRQILVMPTWRNWLEHHSPEEFVTSDFFVNYQRLLRSERLSSVLVENDAQLLFVLHPYFSKFVAQMGPLPARMSAVRAEDRPINELLMESSLLISDYSSVVWDFFKMKKPVVFFHFDSDEYLKQHGSFIDFNSELIGPRASDVEGVVEEIESSLKAQFALSSTYVAAHERTFPLDDRKNCERIYSVVEKLQNEPRHEFIQFVLSVLGLSKLSPRKAMKGWLKKVGTQVPDVN